MKVSCKQYVQNKKEELRKQVENTQRMPALAIIQVGDNPASNSYISGKIKDCHEIGMVCYHTHLDEDSTEQELLNLIDSLNEDKYVDGIIVQLPLPKHLKNSIKKIQKRINVFKDVDGFRSDSEFKPCTPKGIIDWLDFNDLFDFAGVNVAVIGRSDIVGKPLVNMFIEKGATVTCCNSKTENIKYYTRNADIIVSAIGKPKYFDSKYFKQGQIIIDVGINRDENGKLCGDVDDKYIFDSYVTPVPGGVGLLTRIALLENVLHAYYINGGK